MAQRIIHVGNNKYMLDGDAVLGHPVVKIHQIDDNGLKTGISATVIDRTFGNPDKNTSFEQRFVPLTIELFNEDNNCGITYYYDYDSINELDKNIAPMGRLVRVCLDGKQMTGAEIDKFKIEAESFYDKSFWLVQDVFDKYENIVRDCLKSALTQKPTGTNPQATQDLLYACANGYTEKALDAIYAGADVNARNKEGLTPLMISIKYGHAQIVIILIDMGADIEATNDSNDTVLTQACAYGQSEIAEILIDKGANINHKSNYGWTPLIFAAANMPKITKKLINKGADLDVMDSDGQTALIAACFASGNIETATMLVEAGADINIRGKNYGTAIECTNNEEIKNLLRSAMNKQKSTKRARRAKLAPSSPEFLIKACCDNDKTQVKLALDSGAYVNAKGTNGVTALTFAVINKNKEIVEMLIKAKADVNAKDNFGKTALIDAATNGYNEILGILIKAGADVNAKDNNGETALMKTAFYKKSTTIDILIKAGADINAKDKDGNTVLMNGTKSWCEDIVKILIDAGADVNAKNKYGKTAFDIAEKKEIKELLYSAMKSTKAPRLNYAQLNCGRGSK